MTQEDNMLAIAQAISRIDDLIKIERLVFAAWQGEKGQVAQFNRVWALERARATLANDLATPATSA